jgi:hypothetical protein
MEICSWHTALNIGNAKMPIEKWQGTPSLQDPIYRPKKRTKKIRMPPGSNTKKMTK